MNTPSIHYFQMNRDINTHYNHRERQIYTAVMKNNEQLLGSTNCESSTQNKYRIKKLKKKLFDLFPSRKFLLSKIRFISSDWLIKRNHLTFWFLNRFYRWVEKYQNKYMIFTRTALETHTTQFQWCDNEWLSSVCKTKTTSKQTNSIVAIEVTLQKHFIYAAF